MKKIDDSLFDSIISEVMPQQLSKIGLAITDLATKDPTFRRAIQQIKPERPGPTTAPGREDEEEIDLDDIDPNVLRSLDRAAQRGQIDLPEATGDLPDALDDLARELMEPDATGSEAVLLSVAEFYELDPEHLRRVFLAQKKVGSLQNWRSGMAMESRKAVLPNQLKESAEKFGIPYEDFEAAMRRTLKRIRTKFSEDRAKEFKQLMAEKAISNPRQFVAWLGIRDKILSEKYPNFEQLKARLSEKWGTKTKTPKSEKGKYKGKTQAELKSMRSGLKAKKDRTTEETERLREINFALRAKTGWGKVPD